MQVKEYGGNIKMRISMSCYLGQEIEAEKDCGVVGGGCLYKSDNIQVFQ